MNEVKERVFVIQPIESDRYRVLQEEAVALIESANADYAGTVYQKIREINPATYIGEGKAAEIAELISGLDVTVLFNGELSPSQTLNLSAIFGGRKVIDRTTLILDIFALRAQSSEGKIQVELAQLKYLYPRLRGKGEALSRLGGGIGTRGPGETQLETDRRHIRSRIDALERKLQDLQQRRTMLAERRKKDKVLTIALVGYTNTGKSTLLNALTGADAMVKNALFATLDPTSRSFEIEGVPFLLIDTVGFLQDLPHHLIEAFRSTLESAVWCDLALIVCNVAGEYEMEKQTTLSTLREMGFHSPYLLVYNQCDRVADPDCIPHDGVAISAKYKLGLDELRAKIYEMLQENFVRCCLSIPYAAFSEYRSLRPILIERQVNYTDSGMEVEAIVPAIHASKVQKFRVK